MGSTIVLALPFDSCTVSWLLVSGILILTCLPAKEERWRS
jgi:hypothetical protein